VHINKSLRLNTHSLNTVDNDEKTKKIGSGANYTGFAERVTYEKNQRPIYIFGVCYKKFLLFEVSAWSTVCFLPSIRAQEDY